MSLTFTITPPYTDSPSPFTVNPSHYRIVQPFMGHQQLEFEQFKTSPRIERRSKVAVTGDDPDKTNFLGWVVQYDQPNPAKNKPQKYICYGFSKDLEWRYPWLKTYTTGQNLQTILNHTPASEGLLYRANSLVPDCWGLMDAGLHLYGLDFAGCSNAARFSSPTIYLGTTLTTGLDPYTDPYSLGVNEWCQDDYTLYLRTGGNDPYDYPCYIVDYKQAYLKRSASASYVQLLGDINPSQESEYSLLKRIMRSVGMEFEFVNSSDGYQYLNWGTECARGNVWDPSAENAFAFEEAGCGYGYQELYDWSWSILDPETYGFDLISLRGKNIVANYVGQNIYYNNTYMYWRHWKEDIRRDSSMGNTQVYTEGAYLRDHYMREDVLNIWAPENHSILPGDWAWVYLCTAPFDNEYLGRVLEKTLEDGVMKLSLGLFLGDPWW
jgi:hypothetical protein